MTKLKDIVSYINRPKPYITFVLELAKQLEAMQEELEIKDLHIASLQKRITELERKD